MHLEKAVVTLAFATGVLAAVAAVPTGGGSVVVERPGMLPRDGPEPMRAMFFVPGENEGSHSDSDVLSVLEEVSNSARDLIECWHGGDHLQRDEGIMTCLEISTKTFPKAKREANNAAHVVTEQETVTAAPAGTTTVYVPPPSSRPTPDEGVPDLPHELIMTQTSDGTTITTTAVVQTTVVATVTTADDSAWTSASTLTEGQSKSALATLTDPINPDVTSIIIAGAPTTTCVNNTSIDTHSYIDISTFSASGLSLPSTTASPSTSSTSPTTTSLSVDSSLLSRMSSEMAKSTSVGSETITLGGHGPSTGTLPTSFATASGANAPPNSSDAVIVDGRSVLATILVGMAACLVLALFL